MIKNLLSIALTFSSIAASAQAFTGTYDFAATTTVSGTTDPTTPPSATGVTFSPFTAVGTPSANANAGGRFSFVGWPAGATNGNDLYSSLTGSINPGEYYEFTITPQAGFTVSLNSIAFTVQRSGTGIRSYAVKTSADGFTSNLPASVVSNATLSVVGTNEFFWNFDAASNAQNGSMINLFGATISGATAFRFYGWNSEAAGGTFSIDNVVINGSVAAGSCTAPAISSVTSNGPICSNQGLTLQANATGTGPLTYAWFGTGSFSSTSVSNPTVTGASTGSYGLAVSNACGTATAAINVTVTPTPTVSVNAASICSGGTATLVANGATTYSWSPGATLNATTGATVNANPTSTTIYTIVGTSGTCSTAVTTTVSVISTPTLAVNSVSMCAGSTATLNATGVSTYTWTSPVSNNASISVSPASTTVYTVSGNAAGCAGTFTATGTVSVTALPSLTITPTSPTICAGQATTLTVTGATTQTWAPGSQTTASVAVTPTSTVTYTVAGMNAGCMNTKTVIVNVNPLPTVTSTSASICTGKTATLTASGTAVSYTWNPGAVTGTTYTVAPSGTFTTYTVTGTSAQGCNKSTSVNVIVIPNPNIAVTASGTLICAGSSVTLTALGTATSYTWSNGVANGTGFTPTTTATYTVTGSLSSCTGTAVATVSVSPCTGIEENTNAAVLTVYPNPNNGNFIVQSSVFPATLVMYDVTGKQVIRKEITEMETTLNVSQLNNGIYYMSLTAENGSMNYKLIIAK
jgi:hypothetical protein